MAFDRATAVAKSRRIVHDSMKVAAVYTHPAFPGVVTPLFVRVHNRALVQGNLVETGYADVVEGVNQVVFDLAELNEKSIVLRVGGQVTMVPAQYNGAVFILDNQQPDTGPVNRVWGVTKP